MNLSYYHRLDEQADVSTPQIQSWLRQLREPDSRRVVIDAIQSVFKRWQLHPINQAALLDLADISELDDYIEHATSPLIFARIGHLLVIDRVLAMLYPYEADRCNNWVWETLPELQGLTPMSLMLREGLVGIAGEGIVDVRTVHMGREFRKLPFL